MRDDIGFIVGMTIVALIAALALILWLASPAAARNGWHGAPELKEWFDGLRSPRGAPCCSTTDGWYPPADAVQWDIAGNKYRVLIEGAWYDVPADAVIAEPNRFGRAVVWYRRDQDGKVVIVCFLPGAGI